MLTVIGIIGVVSALAIPNLNTSISDKDKVAKAQKIYRDLNEAYNRATAIYGPVEKWFVQDNGQSEDAYRMRLGERISEFMNVSKNCKTSQGCFKNANTKTINGIDDSNLDTQGGYKLITADGMSVYFGGTDSCNSSDRAVSCPSPLCNLCSVIVVDIDGPTKGPNLLCKDIYTFYSTKWNGVIPQGREDEAAYSTDAKLKSECFVKKDCTAWVIDNGNMDFIKADNNGKCPNGTVLSRTVTTCK